MLTYTTNPSDMARKLITPKVFLACLTLCFLFLPPPTQAADFTHEAGLDFGVSFLQLREPDDDTSNINLSAAALYRPLPFLAFGLGAQVGLLEMLLESEDNHDITGAPLMFPIFAELIIPVTKTVSLQGRAGRALGLYRYTPETCENFFRLNDTSACTDGKYSERHVGDYFGASLAFRQEEGVKFYVGFKRLQLPNTTRFNLYELGFRFGLR